jgi:hypothetical protein
MSRCVHHQRSWQRIDEQFGRIAGQRYIKVCITCEDTASDSGSAAIVKMQARFACVRQIADLQGDLPKREECFNPIVW